MIVTNLSTHTTAFLDDVSADLFELLAIGDEDAIGRFRQEHDISECDTAGFLDDLIQQSVIGENVAVQTLSDSSVFAKEVLADFQKMLFNNGYLYELHFDITNRCDLRCRHCYQVFEDTPTPPMDIDEVRALIDDCCDLGVFNITISGGEPMMSEHFRDIVRYVTHKGIAAVILTNGTMITDEDIAFIKGQNVQALGVSLYSMNADRHDGITCVKGSHTKTMAALTELKKAGLDVRVSHVMLRENYGDYKEIDAFCKANGFSLVIETSIAPKLDGGDQPLSLAPTEEQLVGFALDRSYGYFIGHGEPLKDSAAPCSVGRTSLYCNATGQIFPCVGLPLLLGSSKDVKQIWTQSDQLDTLRAIKIGDLKTRNTKEECRHCFNICPGTSFIENRGDFLVCEGSQCAGARARYVAWQKLHQG